jgi:hypothetical protein
LKDNINTIKSTKKLHIKEKKKVMNVWFCLILWSRKQEQASPMKKKKKKKKSKFEKTHRGKEKSQRAFPVSFLGQRFFKIEKINKKLT